MTAQTSMLHIRVDDDIKDQATLSLAAMGQSISDAVRLFLRRVVIDQAFPLELKVPNAETLAKTAASKRAALPRAADYAKAFLKDWQRLLHSGRFDLVRLKEDPSAPSGWITP
jgi:DNA-damage-inducible protein J